MRIKNKRKILASFILLNGMFNSSLASTLSEDGRYETFSGNNIKINDILENDKVDVEVEGKTLVNLLNVDRVVQAGWGASVSNDGLIKVNVMSENDEFANSYGSSKFDCSIDKNKEYSLVLDIKKNTLNSSFKFYNYGTYMEFPFNQVTLLPGDVGFKVFKLEHSANELNDSMPYGYHMLTMGYDANAGVGNTIEFTAMILEGDYTGHEYIEYFKGMKSVGEDTNSLNIHTSNENLFNGDYEVGSIDLTGNGADINTDVTVDVYRSKYLEVKPNKKYTFSLPRSICFYDSKKERITNIFASTIITPENCKYIRFQQYGNVPVTMIEGEIATNKEHISSIKNIENIVPLRGIENGVKDRIVKKNGQWYIERNLDEMELNGSEDWMIHGNIQATDKVIYFASFNEDVGVNMENTTLNAINDKLPSITRVMFDTNKGCEGVAAYVKWWSIGIEKSKLISPDVAGLKDYLSKNPIKAVYVLASPKYEPINMDLAIDLFEGDNHIWTDSIVSPGIKVTVDRTPNRAKEAIEIARVNPTAANISQARYWSNLMKDSTLKDEFQEQITTNTTPVDLTIDRKKTSANIDVYVKMKNSLSLSLDTNSITFEDFNASEDMEKKNAVNLIVSSSLPYKVNAFLESEIYNADKTATIDKSVLNIKNSSDTTYKAFNNISESIVLLDNQIEGDNTSHSLDLILRGGSTHKPDAYKTTLKFEVEQK